MPDIRQVIIVHRRCDKPMKRSKEKPRGIEPRWKCTGRCKECFCCIETDENGNEWHVNLLSTSRKRDNINDKSE